MPAIWQDSRDLRRRADPAGHEIKEFLKQGTAKRLHLGQLPGYAPDLNLNEGIWNDLK